MQNFWTLNEFIKNAVRQKVVEQEMFNVELQTFMDTQMQHMKFLNVPWVVRLTADDMIRRGLVLEGLFRVPGQHNIINSICEAARYGLVPDFEQSACNLEEVSGVFKKYIRELPSPLFVDDDPSKKLHQEFHKVIELTSEEEQIVTLNNLIKQLTPCRRALAKEIFLVFFLVSLEHEANFMTSLNLGTIFGGMVDIISKTMFSDEKKRLCTFIIDHYPRIFHDIDTLKKPVLEEMTVEEKTAKAVITIFLDDGTFRTFWGTGAETALSIRDSVVKKLQATVEVSVVERYKLYEIRDREVRLLDDDEFVVPLLRLHKTLLCTNKLNPQEIQIPWHISLACKRANHFEDSRLASMSAQFESAHSGTDQSASIHDEKTDAAERQAVENEEQEFKKLLERQQEMLAKKKDEPVVVQKQASPEVLEKVKQLNERFVKLEAEYLEKLRIYSKFYLPAFKAVKDKDMVDDINLIFYPALSGLLHLHEQVATRLTAENIPQVLLSMTSYFKVYGQVCNNQEMCIDVSRRLSKKSDKFQALLVKCKKESKAEAFDLIEFLELPGKRIQQYQEQILEIIQTCKDEPIPHLSHIKEAYVALTRLNNDNAEQTEVSKTRVMIMNLLDKIDIASFPAGFELMLPTRRFLKAGEGIVKVDGTVVGTFNLVLFNDIILIYHSNASEKEKDKSKKGLGLMAKKDKVKTDKGKVPHYLNINLKNISKLKIITNDTDIIGQVISLESTNGNETHNYVFSIKDPQNFIFLVNGSIEIMQSLDREKQHVLVKRDPPLTTPSSASQPAVHKSVSITDSALNIPNVSGTGSVRVANANPPISLTASSPANTHLGRLKPDGEVKVVLSFTESESQNIAKRTASNKRHRSKSVSVVLSKETVDDEFNEASAAHASSPRHGDKSARHEPGTKHRTKSGGSRDAESRITKSGDYDLTKHVSNLPDLPSLPKFPPISAESKKGFTSRLTTSDGLALSGLSNLQPSPKDKRQPVSARATSASREKKTRSTSLSDSGSNIKRKAAVFHQSNKDVLKSAATTDSANPATSRDAEPSAAIPVLQVTDDANAEATAQPPSTESTVAASEAQPESVAAKEQPQTESNATVTETGATADASVTPVNVDACTATTTNPVSEPSDGAHQSQAEAAVTTPTAVQSAEPQPSAPEDQIDRSESADSFAMPAEIPSLPSIPQAAPLISSGGGAMSTLQFLAAIGLEKFAKAFEDEGWTDPAEFKSITLDNLATMGFKSGHINTWKKSFPAVS